jgi:diguanylate cyclase (GGDEF)-like protein
MLLFAGMREFVGRASWPRWVLPGAVGAYALVGAAVAIAYGSAGRYTLLNATLGAAYLGLAAISLRATPHQPAPLRAPLHLLSALVGLLGMLTITRAAWVARIGNEALYAGRFAQVFYAYASLAAVLLALVLLWMVFVRMNLELAELASRDALTRVLNRNGLDEALTRHFGDRGAGAVTLLQLDLDHFKRVNDDHGHATGDALLRAIGAALRAQVRPNDFVARTGGEEFLVGCITSDPAHAVAFAERLRRAIGAVVVPTADGRGTVGCTASVGISRPFSARSDWERAASEADDALYAAKSAGRDRVVASAATSTAGWAATLRSPVHT